MPAALNTFRTVTATVTNVIANVYTAPQGYSAVVLLAQVSNLNAGTILVSGNIRFNMWNYIIF